MTWEMVVAFATALGAGAILRDAVSAFTHRRSMNADAAKTMTEAAVLLVGPLTKQVAALEAEVATLRETVKRLNKQLEEAEGRQ